MSSESFDPSNCIGVGSRISDSDKKHFLLRLLHITVIQSSKFATFNYPSSSADGYSSEFQWRTSSAGRRSDIKLGTRIAAHSKSRAVRVHRDSPKHANHIQLATRQFIVQSSPVHAHNQFQQQPVTLVGSLALYIRRVNPKTLSFLWSMPREYSAKQVKT
jgi:hypothetical protein